MKHIFTISLCFLALSLSAQSFDLESELFRICRNFENNIHESEDACDEAYRQLNWLLNDIEDLPYNQQSIAEEVTESVQNVLGVIGRCQMWHFTSQDLARTRKYLSIDVGVYPANGKCIQLGLATVGADGFECHLIYNDTSKLVRTDCEYQGDRPPPPSSVIYQSPFTGKISCGLMAKSFCSLFSTNDEKGIHNIRITKVSCEIIDY